MTFLFSGANQLFKHFICSSVQYSPSTRTISEGHAALVVGGSAAADASPGSSARASSAASAPASSTGAAGAGGFGSWLADTALGLDAGSALLTPCAGDGEHRHMRSTSANESDRG